MCVHPATDVAGSPESKLLTPARAGPSPGQLHVGDVPVGDGLDEFAADLEQVRAGGDEFERDLLAGCLALLQFGDPGDEVLTSAAFAAAAAPAPRSVAAPARTSASACRSRDSSTLTSCRRVPASRRVGSCLSDARSAKTGWIADELPRRGLIPLSTLLASSPPRSASATRERRRLRSGTVMPRGGDRGLDVGDVVRDAKGIGGQRGIAGSSPSGPASEALSAPAPPSSFAACDSSSRICLRRALTSPRSFKPCWRAFSASESCFVRMPCPADGEIELPLHGRELVVVLERGRRGAVADFIGRVAADLPREFGEFAAFVGEGVGRHVVGGVGVEFRGEGRVENGEPGTRRP